MSPSLTLVLLMLCFPLAMSSNKYMLTGSDVVSANQTLVGEVFELGLFALENRWYLGIWYRNLPNRTYVWVANRHRPLNNFNGTLRISDAKLVLHDETQKEIWSSELVERDDGSSSSPLVAELLHNGNFVLRFSDNSDPDSYLWQSFYYPTDTLLPEMSLRYSYSSEIQIVSWKDEGNPAKGDYAFDLNGLDSIRLRILKGNRHLYLSEAWSGVDFANVPLKFNLTVTGEEAICVYQSINNHTLTRILLTHYGWVLGLMWNQTSEAWDTLWRAPSSLCDVYNTCGVNSYCNIDTNELSAHTCKCIPGFEPIQSNSTKGCVRKTKLSCFSNEFFRFTTMKLPDTSAGSGTNQFVFQGLDKCEDKCSEDCYCNAYAVLDNEEGSLSNTCTTWRGNLIELGNYNSSAGQSIYIRVNGRKKKKERKKISIAVYLIIGLSIFALCLFCVALYCYRRRRQERMRPAPAATTEMEMRMIREGATDDHESLPHMDFATIVVATENFSHEIGKGGFGSVYKGTLANGTDIAVKKMSKLSDQGTDEFYTEAISIRRLRHVNIVRLYGWSIHNEEKLLIYEYLENGSLERRIFSGGDLDWEMRFLIIKGIAQGLAYIEEGFQETMVHRDLKPANILLDRDMTPKISDFGFARVYGRADNDGSFTERPAGTFGYMAPEYVRDGIYSAKSDIFSFGVTVLEIISGKRNKLFNSDMGPNINLLEYAWIKLDEGNYSEIVDEKIREDCLPNWQVLRCIEVGLMCVHQQPTERPNMSLVVTMLQEENFPTTKPQRPGTITDPTQVASTSYQDPSESTTNRFIEPITQVYAR